MNIIITQELHEYLQSIIIETLLFGSRANGNNYTEDSDYDYLHIVACHKSLVTTPIYAGHWLQYKEVDANGKTIADHVYSTIPQFIHGVAASESMIPWEILYNSKNVGGYQFGLTRDNSVKQLWTLTEEPDEVHNYVSHNSLMFNFKTARGFLGLARRDAKDASKFYNSDKARSWKKIQFVIKSLNYATMCLSKVYVIDTGKRLNWGGGVDPVLDCWDTSYQAFEAALAHLNKSIEELRTLSQDYLNRKLIPYTTNVVGLRLIHDKYLKELNFIDDNKYSDMMMEYYYKAAIENEFK